jgi:hypothetical protein
MTGNVDGPGVTHKDLAGEIDAKGTVFQTTLCDTTLKERALAAGGQPKLVAAARTSAVLAGTTVPTVTAAGSGLFASHAASIVHAQFPLPEFELIIPDLDD